MIRFKLKEEWGGTAILTALGFLLFSIPLISGSLGLAQAASIDARVKADKVSREYCSLAVVEFFDYLMADTTRFKAWMVEHDPTDSGTATGTLDLSNVDCGFSVDTDTPAVGGDPVGGAVGTVPFLGIFQQRKFQTFKIVDEPNPNAGDPVLYTIKIVNRVAQPVSLTDIRDTLPDGFTYACDGPANMITLPGETAKKITPTVDCPSGTGVTWSSPASGLL